MANYRTFFLHPTTPVPIHPDVSGYIGILGTGLDKFRYIGMLGTASGFGVSH